MPKCKWRWRNCQLVWQTVLKNSGNWKQIQYKKWWENGSWILDPDFSSAKQIFEYEEKLNKVETDLSNDFIDEATKKRKLALWMMWNPKVRKKNLTQVIILVLNKLKVIYVPKKVLNAKAITTRKGNIIQYKMNQKATSYNALSRKRMRLMVAMAFERRNNWQQWRMDSINILNEHIVTNRTCLLLKEPPTNTMVFSKHAVETTLKKALCLCLFLRLMHMRDGDSPNVITRNPC